MESLIKKVHPSQSIFFSVVLVSFVYILSIAFLEKRGFWVVDNANKFLQVQSIITSNYTDYSIPWPGKALDPDFIYNPLPSPFSYINDHKLYSIFSPVFALISSFLYRLCGLWGLYILPAVSSIIMLIGLAKIGKVMGLGRGARHGIVLFTGLCTPIWFYSITFWEHIVAVSLCVWALYFFSRYFLDKSLPYLIWGSICATVSIYFRDELYLFCLVLVGILYYYTPVRKTQTIMLVFFSMFLTIIPLWIFQWKTIGQPFGFHLGTHLFSEAGITEHFLSRPKVLYYLFVSATPSTWVSFLVIVPYLCLFVLNPRFSERGFTKAVPLYCIISLVCSFFIFSGYITTGDPLKWMFFSNSLFTASPLLILAFLRKREEREKDNKHFLVHIIWVVTLSYAIVYGLIAPEKGSQGIHWGNRYVLILYPLFALLATRNLSDWFTKYKNRINWHTWIVVITILLSIAAQGYSVYLLNKKQTFSYHLNREVQKLPEKVIITNSWWVPQELYSEFYSKLIFYAPTRESYANLLMKLRNHGYKQFVFITYRSESSKQKPIGSVHEEGLDMFSLQFYADNIP